MNAASQASPAPMVGQPWMRAVSSDPDDPVGIGEPRPPAPGPGGSGGSGGWDPDDPTAPEPGRRL